MLNKVFLCRTISWAFMEHSSLWRFESLSWLQVRNKSDWWFMGPVLLVAGATKPCFDMPQCARLGSPIRARATVPLYVTKPWRQKQEFSFAWWILLHEAISCHGPQSSRDGIRCSCYFWPRRRYLLFTQEFLRWVSSRDDWSVFLSHQMLFVLFSNLHRLLFPPRMLSWFVDLINWLIFPRMPNNSFLTSLNAPLSEW